MTIEPQLCQVNVHQEMIQTAKIGQAGYEIVTVDCLICGRKHN